MASRRSTEAKGAIASRWKRANVAVSPRRRRVANAKKKKRLRNASSSARRSFLSRASSALGVVPRPLKGRNEGARAAARSRKGQASPTRRSDRGFFFLRRKFRSMRRTKRRIGPSDSHPLRNPSLPSFWRVDAYLAASAEGARRVESISAKERLTKRFEGDGESDVTTLRH